MGAAAGDCDVHIVSIPRLRAGQKLVFHYVARSIEFIPTATPIKLLKVDVRSASPPRRGRQRRVGVASDLPVPSPARRRGSTAKVAYIPCEGRKPVTQLAQFGRPYPLNLIECARRKFNPNWPSLPSIACTIRVTGWLDSYLAKSRTYSYGRWSKLLVRWNP